jgi:uncharacterized protein
MSELLERNDGVIDYFTVIHRVISPDSRLYRIYVPHVTCVTQKALSVAERLNLTADQRRFIEEAAMLHDIGIVRVHAPDIGCHGDLPYPTHILEGSKILRGLGLHRHARVAERHIGVGITAQEIESQRLPLPQQNFISETLTEQLISWADLFYGKHPGQLWSERSVAEVRSRVARYGARHVETFDLWQARFGTP